MHSRAFIRTLVLAALLSSGTGPLWGQASSTGNIRGLVTDTSGAVIPGVGVQIVNQETDESWSVLTNDLGVYQKSFLPAGLYRVSASMTGFKVQSRVGVRLSAQDTVRVDLVLQVGDLAEEVTVSGSAVEADTATSDISKTLSETQILELPMLSRSFDFFILQQPGVQLDRTSGYGSFSFNGSSVQGNNYLLDGTDATFIEVNSTNTEIGSVNTVSLSAIAEIRTSTSNFSAEEGRASGGVVNIISKRGTDSFHGEMYYFHRNDWFNANDFFANREGEERPVLKQHQGGFSLGGPIATGKTFFFGNWEFVRIKRPQTFEIQVPTATFLARPDIDAAVRPIFDLYPSANVDIGDPNIGLFRFTSSPPHRQDLFLLRIDHQFDDNDSVFFRYNINDNTEERFLSPCFLDCPSTTTRRAQQFTASWIHALSPTLVNEARFGFNRTVIVGGDRDRPTDPALGGRSLEFRDPEGTGQVFGDIFSIGKGFSSPQDLDQYYDNLSWTTGRHSFKFGFDLRRLRQNRRQGSPDDLVRVATLEELAGNEVQSLQEQGRFVSTGLRSSSWAFYVQDDLTVNNRLTLNLGVRYEYNQPYKDLSGRTITFGPCCLLEETNDFGSWNDFLSGSFQRIGGRLYPPDRNNVAPRVGFAVDLFGNGRTALRGGTGVYYGLNMPPGVAIWDNLQYQLKLMNVPRVLSGPLNFPLPDLDALPPQPNDTYYFNVYYGPHPFDMRDNYALHFNLSLEHEIASDTLVKAGYVGNHNLHFSDVNHGVNNFDPLTGEFLVPEFTVPMLDPVTGSLTDEKRSFLSYYYTGWVSLSQPSGRSRYDSLQASVTHRTPSFTADFNYTWSKYIANTYTDPLAGYYSASGAYGYASNNVQNLADRDGTNRGPHILDTRHALVGNFVYQVPRPANLGGLVEKLVTGWTLGSVMRFYTGKPFTVATGELLENGNLWMFAGTQRPDQVGPIKPGSYASNAAMLDSYLLAGAFAAPEYNSQTGLSVGNLGRNSIRAPGFRQVDFAIGKKTFFGWFGAENAFLDLRIDVFNLFNNTNFAEPESIMANPTFGQIRRTLPAFNGGGSRELQVSAKIVF